ncbi:hypothetical protein D3C71_1856320 [compost metagenome]
MKIPGRQHIGEHTRSRPVDPFHKRLVVGVLLAGFQTAQQVDAALVLRQWQCVFVVRREDVMDGVSDLPRWSAFRLNHNTLRRYPVFKYLEIAAVFPGKTHLVDDRDPLIQERVVELARK